MEPEPKSLGEAMGGCGLKRKAEEHEEVAAVDVVVVGDRSKSEQVVLPLPELEEGVYEYSSEDDDDDSDEDPEECLAKIKARFAARELERRARYPHVIYEDRPVVVKYPVLEDSPEEESPEEEDSPNDYKFELGDVVDGALLA